MHPLNFLQRLSSLEHPQSDYPSSTRKKIKGKKKLYVIMAKVLGTLSSLSTKGEIKAFNALSAIPDEELNLLCYYETINDEFHYNQKKKKKQIINY